VPNSPTEGKSRQLRTANYANRADWYRMDGFETAGISYFDPDWSVLFTEASCVRRILSIETVPAWIVVGMGSYGAMQGDISRKAPGGSPAMRPFPLQCPTE